MRTHAETNRNIDLKMEQLKNHKITKDVLKNDAFPFENEMVTAYYSNCRRFLKSKNAHRVMEFRL